MQQDQAKELFLKYQSGKCTDQEKAIVEKWLNLGEATPFNLTNAELSKNLKDLDQKLDLELNIKKHPFNYSFAAFAAFLILFSLGLYFYVSKPRANVTNTASPSSVRDVDPGSNMATFVSNTGKKVNLKEVPDQILVHQKGFNLFNTKEGQLVYRSTSKADLPLENPLAIHTVFTPRGGQYQIVLPDGTKVWLNSASSLEYPALFTANERRVELKGEAYFEVAKNAAKPFKVIVNSTTVKVLGTHFNVMAYADDQVTKTTLLEGSVQLENGTKINTLKPGQQAIVNKDGDVRLITVDPEQAVAWKNGYFSFNRTSLKEIMKQLSRWYNVDVIYKGKVPIDEEFVGKIKRDAPLSKALDILQFSGLRFEITGHQLTITPK
ncbi:FecR domain-containing protein [Pedobacter sp. PAMC26386]|nr:FecR domain-containing protein [Pedobacter sp. PAMC26386]